MNFGELIKNENAYHYTKFKDLVGDINNLPLCFKLGKKERVYYYSIPCSFDIETSSFRNDKGEKRGCMYIWQFCFNGIVFIGRTWNEYIEFIETVTKTLEITENKRLIVYIHNLDYEFQWFRKWFKWQEVFSIDERKPLYAITKQFIEYRCSYKLSGYSLENVGKNLHKYKINKMVGSLDYNLIRTPKTELTQEELQYCINDVRVVCAYIQELIEEYGSILKLPLTNTGFVRNLLRKNIIGERTKTASQRSNMNKIQNEFIIQGDKELIQLFRAFQGGFVHSNPYYFGTTLTNVSSYDLTSAYPSVMVLKKFPMSKGTRIEIRSKKEFENYLENYLCVFDVRFKNIVSIFDNEHIISLSKCIELENEIECNGRIVSADKLTTTITNIDFKNIKRFYSWDSIEVANFTYYKPDYLPKEMIETVLDLYTKKTTLKGVENEEVNYMRSKGMLNSCYGCIVTKFAKDMFQYDDQNGWHREICNYTESLADYNENNSRFLFYPWGVFITAYVREIILDTIYYLNDDYVYSDTDSVKFLNHEQHKQYFINFNDSIIKQIKEVSKKMKIDENLYKPKNNQDIEYPIGLFDYEGTYDKFKTLGAKRYLTLKNSDYSITVAGLPKKSGVNYLKSLGDPFEEFKEFLFIPGSKSGKLTHTYIDEDMCGYIIDYKGNSYSFQEKSIVHLSECDFNLLVSERFIEYVETLKGLGMLYD